MSTIRNFSINKKIKVYFIIVLIIFIIVTNIYVVNFLISPAIITASEAEIRAQVTEIINSVILKEYTKEFNYDSIIHTEKDRDGNIVMMKADTLRMNKIACDVAIKSQKELKNVGEDGVKIPLGYVLKNNLFAFFGPNITVKMQPVGYIETKYISNFESAGINQTRHKIYVEVSTNMKIIVPLKSENISIKNEVPISETIIVGKVPQTALNLGLDGSGFKLQNQK
ncbi:sporulation protein YunB [Clostridium fermenticellae]|uniref:Sporulation protein YunB n=1 Tax=Clostridium fermenticellae TaxID=2068654 RepID=A0A386H2M4_9CLOT|nr:sporulation protein YunB [Clostridium fermenticellae]AYD39818.1 sporulation protein YunB [Clostridium fermenticellae]